MFGIGFQEVGIILVVALLVFGPKRLPELARTLGKGLAEFRRASSDLRESIQVDLDADEDKERRQREQLRKEREESAAGAEPEAEDAKPPTLPAPAADGTPLERSEAPEPELEPVKDPKEAPGE